MLTPLTVNSGFSAKAIFAIFRHKNNKKKKISNISSILVQFFEVAIYYNFFLFLKSNFQFKSLLNILLFLKKACYNDVKIIF